MRNQRRSKRIVAFVLAVGLIMNSITCQIHAKTQGEKEQAVLWLQEQAEEHQQWKRDGLINCTCNAMAVLRREGINIESDYLKEWEKSRENYNVDELAHLAWAWNDEKYISQMADWQNQDGGLGLTDEYTSDTYDTFLFLAAKAAMLDEQSQDDNEECATENEEVVQNVVDYLISRQNTDGGFGYHQKDTSKPGLSAQIGIVLSELSVENKECFQKLDDYCQKQFQKDFSEESFVQQAQLARYLYRRNLVKNSEEIEQQLADIQSEDGSIYSDVEDTMEYILLMNEIAHYYELQFNVSDMMTESDSYVLEADEEIELALHTDIQYAINHTLPATIRYTLLENGTEFVRQDVECIFDADEVKQAADAVMKVTATENNEYVLMTEIVSLEEDGTEKIWKSIEIGFTVHKKQEQAFTLQAETVKEENYGVYLSWNDLSDEDTRYGYRVFRKKGDAEWETRSTWDGEEKVKVLNIYPGNAAKNYLVNWMQKTISNSEEPAGKGLFEIGTVFIGDYNKDPEKYLIDEDGNYQYDVLMFGTYDCNNGYDLTEISYNATKKFIESGRGVLFGHDTVVQNSAQTHPIFARFEKELGITFHSSGTGISGNKVEVINEGFLTSYPWEIRGVLTIPYAHSSGQFVEGDKGANTVVWMRFQGKKADDDAYLLSKNSVAMIQTGHSNGQATDDERKILANTLFYLKQLTNETSASDKSFYDEAAPEVTDVSELDENQQVTIRAKDYGTLYQYYVEAVNANSQETNRQSNTVEAEAVSGVKGYVVGISDTTEPMEELLSYDENGNLTSELIAAEDETAVYTVEGLEAGEQAYLHIYAVDYAGNVSEEMVQEITASKAEKAYFNSPYAIFASENVELSCNEAKITGDIYGNDSFKFQGSTLLLDGKASTAGVLSLAGGRMELAEQEEGIEPVVLPDYTAAILQDMETESETIEELSAYNSTEITVPTICKSTSGAWCDNVNIGANLISADTVSLNANTISCGAEQKVVLSSQNGDIRIQCTQFTGNGLIYAPNGTVTINVSEFNFHGTIIAKKVQLQMTNCNINKENTDETLE